ncbi:hypothetical protein [Cypionkella sp.]|jgi:hypothetical protein|uniref:hypothetical protein n=1 Tax=Cypionkella sp. TaxID=2811411 RepID=UPI00275359DF|nr:hypothetical protein [Cypionkella sp.]
MFRPALPAFALLALTFPATAQDVLPCETTPDNRSCARVFACIGPSGRWFEGRGIGRGQGRLDGHTSDGATCTGSWDNGDGLGTLPKAVFSCQDGTQGSVVYFHQDQYTGTAIGRGTTTKGQTVEVWTGEHVVEFFRRGAPSAQALLLCGEAAIPIS